MMVNSPFRVLVMHPVLILLLLGLIAGIILVSRLCSRRRWLAVTATAAFVLLVTLGAGLILLHAPRVVSRNPEVSVNVAPAASEENAAPIWLQGIEDQFEANVYPSKLSAVYSLGLRIGRAVQQVLDAQASPSRFIVFQEAHERSLIDEFARAVSRAFPETPCFIKPEVAGVEANEVGIRLNLTSVQTHPATWLKDSENTVTSGRIEATAMAESKQCTINAGFVEKSWVEDFSAFLNTGPNRQFIIAKSTDSCMTEGEANRQAMQNACAQIGKMLGQVSRRLSAKPVSFVGQVNSDDLLEGGLVVDRFVQSFRGAAGPIWRQALLIDASTERLSQLARQKEALARATRTNWARMFFSVVGLLALITAVYAFLNAATKGYYAWSLRVAGAVLALVVIILFLM